MENTTVAQSFSERRGIILMIASVCCFTATSLLLSYVNQTYGVSGWVASAYRGIIGLIAVVAMQGSTGKLALQRIVTRPLLFMRGLVGGATIPIYYLCIMELGPGRAGMIGGSWPLFGAIFAAVMLREGLSRRFFAYIALALGGLVAVFASKGLEASKPFYDLLSLCGAAAGGLCVVMIRHLRHTESTSNIFASQCIFTLIIGACTSSSAFFITDPTVLGLVLLASIAVVGGQLCITEAFRHINVAKGSTLQMLTPALTVICSASLLGESFSAVEILGGGAILFASYQIVIAKK
ncbi:MAG: DMT family transporter [Opitutaceae bacterium]